MFGSIQHPEAKQCCYETDGKNTTSLKRHVKAHHKQTEVSEMIGRLFKIYQASKKEDGVTGCELCYGSFSLCFLLDNQIKSYMKTVEQTKLN